ncbi:MAG: helix-turn-helix domain-containing protein [Prevotella sp.]|nr:helix-turn-helix domain-containing protein [Prevotella sp.]
MDKTIMQDITIESILLTYKGSHIDNDLVLFDNLVDVPLPPEPHRMKSILLGLCLKGEAQYSVDTEEHTIHPGDAIIISMGQVVDNCTVSADFVGMAIMLSDDFFHEIITGVKELSSLFLFSRAHPVFTLQEDEVTNICYYCKAIKIKLDDLNHHFRRDVVRSFMMAMIYDLSNAIYRMMQSGKKSSRAQHIFAKFIELVENNFRNERRVSWYAQQLSITPKYLSETVKQASHRTPNEWIDNYVILEARVLLKNSTMSIKKISQVLHFPNQSFLGKYFKEHVGMSPSAYRKK